MKLLITGSTGLLGSACKRLLEKSYTIQESSGVDLRNPQAVYWMFQRLNPDLVIHAAAKVGGVKANRDNPVAFLEENVHINGNVIAACHAFGVKKLVFVATSCMFPKDATIPVKESSLFHGPLEPDVEAYAQAKIMGHILCNAYRREHGCNFVTCAPSNLYGPNDSYELESAHVIPALIRKAVEAKASKTKMKVWGSGDAIRDFLHADDAAAAIKVILEKYSSPEVISIGSGRGTTIRYLADTIAFIAGVKGIEWDDSQPTGIHAKTFDISKLKSLGWEPSVQLQHGLSQVYSDYINDIDIRKR